MIPPKESTGRLCDDKAIQRDLLKHTLIFDNFQSNSPFNFFLIFSKKGYTDSNSHGSIEQDCKGFISIGIHDIGDT